MIFPRSTNPHLDIFVQDEFWQQTSSSSLIGELTWVSTTSASAANGSTAGHPGIWKFTCNDGVTGRLYNNYVGAQITAFDGTTMLAVVKPDQVSSGTIIDFGIQYVNAANQCRKMLKFEKAVSDNWQLCHVNSAGTIVSAVDTTVPAVADWTILQLIFSAGDVTCGYVKTASAEARVENTTSVGALGTPNHTPQFTFGSATASGAKSYQVDLFRMWGTSTRL
jgi:hypothetical protein